MKMILKRKYLEKVVENSLQKESHHPRLIKQVREVDLVIILLCKYYWHIEPKEPSPGRGQGGPQDRLLSSKDLEIKTLSSKLSETKRRLQEVEKENQILKRLQVYTFINLFIYI